MKKWNGVHHKNANKDGHYCVRCGKKVKDDGIFLEMNCATGAYRNESMPAFKASESQGWFEFGPDCAAKTLKEQA